MLGERRQGGMPVLPEHPSLLAPFQAPPKGCLGRHIEYGPVLLDSTVKPTRAASDEWHSVQDETIPRRVGNGHESQVAERRD